MKKNWNWILLITSVLFLTVEISACKKQKEVKEFRVAYVDSGGGFPNDILGVAIEKGYLEKQLSGPGYTVKTIPFAGAGPAINEALASGGIDAAITGDVPAVLGKAHGIDTVLIGAEIAINDSALVVPEGSPANLIQDLKGKKVATLKGSYMHRVLVSMLEANGMAIADIEFVNATSPDAAAAIISKTVDGALLAQIQYAKVVTEGAGTALLSGTENPDWKGGHSILVKTDYLKKNPDAAVALLKALLEANEFAKNNRDEAINILAKSGVSVEAIKFLHPGKIDFNILGGNDILKAHQEILDFLLANDLADNNISIKDWIDSQTYNKAAGAK
jgi:sulfonate transport system substrate-binding protein